MHSSLLSSKKQDWGTPQSLFDELDREFSFDLDAAAGHENHKCRVYFTKEMNALDYPWRGVVWCNPPYGRQVGKWVAHAAEQAREGRATVVMLLPARTDTRWFHTIWDKHLSRPRPNVQVRFLGGRLTFEGASDPAPFPSMIVVFRPTCQHCGQARQENP